MDNKTLAIKYRPRNFDDVTEQQSVKTILMQQLESKTVKNAYLFCGGAGTGKTTCARIFANEINKGEGNPIEMDAASNSGVDDVRMIIQQAKTKSLDSEYKVFIIDECHSISNTGWQAFLKLIEEPPAKSIFIFCTTDPQKIPKTILSRVQRYDFQRISTPGIVKRLETILSEENYTDYDIDSVRYIARIADGGMRDAITMMDKCLAYSEKLTLENVIKALGTTDYDTMLELTNHIMYNNTAEAIECIERVHSSGKDLKQFIKQYINFLVGVLEFYLQVDEQYIDIPLTENITNWLVDNMNTIWRVEDKVTELLEDMMKLYYNIKYSQSVRNDVNADILLFMRKRGDTE